MDRELDPRIRRNLVVRRGVLGLLVLGFVAAVLVWGPGWLKPSISRSRVRTFIVDVGSIEASITASGTVVPEFEQVISSPIDARVVKVLKHSGDRVFRGDPIMDLDIGASRLALEKVDQNLALKRNEQSRTRLDLDHTLISLQSQQEIKNLELQALSAKVKQNRELRKDGLLPEDEVRRAELDEAKARLELKQIEESRRNAEQTTKAQLEGLGLEMSILEKDRNAVESELNRATTKSDREGVLTWVVTDEGATIHKGDVLARIADLGSFRIETKVSDIHANQVKVGAPVKIKIQDAEDMKGVISGILPTIQNGVMTLYVALENKSNPRLRSNLGVDVLILTAQRDRALRIRKGPALTGAGGEVFVLRGPVAVKTPVHLGVSSFDYYEVLQGLIEGDEVILSDMSDYMHLKELVIK